MTNSGSIRCEFYGGLTLILSEGWLTGARDRRRWTRIRKLASPQPHMRPGALNSVIAAGSKGCGLHVDGRS